VPPSLRVSVGTPPATVTTSFRPSVSVTVFPTFRSPVEGDSEIERKIGGGSIAKPGKVVRAPDRSAALPAASITVAPAGKFARVIARVGTVVSAAPTV